MNALYASTFTHVTLSLKVCSKQYITYYYALYILVQEMNYFTHITYSVCEARA